MWPKNRGAGYYFYSSDIEKKSFFFFGGVIVAVVEKFPGPGSRGLFQTKIFLKSLSYLLISFKSVRLKNSKMQF